MAIKFKIENGKLMSADIPTVPRIDKGKCPFCGEPVFVSEGQLLKYWQDQPTHKKCRKQFA